MRIIHLFLRSHASETTVSRLEVTTARRVLLCHKAIPSYIIINNTIATRKTIHCKTPPHFLLDLVSKYLDELVFLSKACLVTWVQFCLGSF